MARDSVPYLINVTEDDLLGWKIGSGSLAAIDTRTGLSVFGYSIAPDIGTMIWQMSWKDVTFSFVTRVRRPSSDGKYPVELFWYLLWDPLDLRPEGDEAWSLVVRARQGIAALFPGHLLGGFRVIGRIDTI